MRASPNSRVHSAAPYRALVTAPVTVLVVVLVAALLSATAVFAAPPRAGDETPVLRITNGEWPPYLSKSLPHHGVASRIVSEAFAVAGIRVEYGFFPWNRAFQLARSGQWDGTAVWLSSPERERDFFLSDAVVEASYVFFYRRDQPFDWKTVDDLAGLRIGATLEYDYGPAFQQAEREGRLRVERVASDEQNFSRLLARRIQVFPMDREVGLTLLRQHFSAAEREALAWHPLPLRVDALRLLLNRKNPANAGHMQRFNAGLKQLRERGSIQRFLEEARATGGAAP